MDILKRCTASPTRAESPVFQYALRGLTLAAGQPQGTGHAPYPDGVQLGMPIGGADLFDVAASVDTSGC